MRFPYHALGGFETEEPEECGVDEEVEESGTDDTAEDDGGDWVEDLFAGLVRC